MSKKYHSLIQGTGEWHDHRATHLNASDAPAMMGVNEYKSRDALLKKIALGIEEEISPALQQRFDDGHKNEALAKPLAEEIIGEELFSPTVSLELDGLKLSASLDGETMGEPVIFEHKTLNKKLAVDIPNGIIAPMYEAQMEQQLLISGADRCLFMASKGGDKASMVHTWYQSNPNLRKRIIDGWKQFVIDLEHYKPIAEIVTVEVKPIESLPSLQIMVTGAITNSNLSVYRESAISFIDSINTDLQSDEDFLTAEKTVKFLKSAENELQNVKKQIFSQTSDIEKAVNTIDHIFEASRIKRLSLDKLVKSQKELRKAEIINKGKQEFDVYMESLLSELSGQTFAAVCNFAVAVKGKRTIESIHNAVNTELANRKIEASGIAGLIRGNLNTYKEMAGDHQFLFNDLSALIQSNPEHFKLTIASRIDSHKKAEQERLDKEREKIRVEEERKAKAAAEEKLKVEQQRINDENERARLEKENKEKIKKVIADDNQAEEPIAIIDDSTAEPPESITDESPEDLYNRAGFEPQENEAEVIATRVGRPIPTGDQMIAVLMNYYETSEGNIINWLSKIDLSNKKNVA